MHDRPAEVYTLDGESFRVDHVERKLGWLVTWEGTYEPTYYPSDRIHHVQRLPVASDAGGSVDHSENGEPAQEASEAAQEEASGDRTGHAEMLRDAFEQAGFSVKALKANSKGSKYRFDIGHADFEVLKDWTSRDDRVGYDGNMNTIEERSVSSYVGDLQAMAKQEAQ